MEPLCWRMICLARERPMPEQLFLKKNRLASVSQAPVYTAFRSSWSESVAHKQQFYMSARTSLLHLSLSSSL